MKRIFILFICAFIYNSSLSQVDTSKNKNFSSSKMKLGYKSKMKWVRVFGEKHVFLSRYEFTENIRLTDVKNGSFYCDTLYSNNLLKSRTLCSVAIKRSQNSFAADSILVPISDTTYNDTIASETYNYSINLIANGSYTMYYQDGKVRVKGKFKKGLKHGKWLFFNKNGDVIRKEKWAPWSRREIFKLKYTFKMSTGKVGKVQKGNVQSSIWPKSLDRNKLKTNNLN